MSSPRATALVEAVHVVIFLCFLVSVTFCFSVMPERHIIEEMITKHEWLPCPDIEPQSDQEKLSSSGGAEYSGGLGNYDRADLCFPTQRSLVSFLPFFVALVGGGVFSLEVFEAFPML
eukprot:TRINITY_DN57383_c0_g1_i1.p1 TRINITY_DN57383_c0_g1~~TRINITY_DN57383_c0_g1_i1.p1  ORF type:complete len:118 (-),score=17.21 TRINITY_DN57383_c0_g1_i1:186-539(-)